ncbi:uncharacterized protein LOC113352180 [Papaver somniferum]|uniref:uncharacterized protein LOC113352180 n=1 Tax=Papaver somniferum TaxID=3469 RepID=UPI000E6FCA89|nr:uncharacterized protein LOC113352180 [Papaver somniferum]
MVVADNPAPLNRREDRGNRRSDPDYNPDGSDYFDDDTTRPGGPAIHEEDRRAMDDLRADMMTEIKHIKAKQGGGRLDQVMKEENINTLAQRLAKALIPQKCSVPSFNCYDGSGDPAAHLRYYNRMMAMWDYEEAILCTYLPSSMKGSALSWFDNLTPDSIDSYDQLTENFLATYMYNKVVSTGMDKLFSFAIYKETIREYTDRWHRICQAIGNVDPVVIINCYKWGLDKMIPLFVEIHGTIPATEGDLRVIIEKHAILEEIQRENPRDQAQRPPHTNSVEQASSSKRGNSDERPNEGRRERRDDRRRDDRKFEDQVYTKLNVSYSRILKEIKGRENLDWPWSKGKQPPRSEKSREYCEYHCFNGHQTEKCKNLKVIIQKLIDTGDLNQYVKKADAEDREKRRKQVQLPEGNRTLNTISCSENTGPSLTSQIGKRLRKQFEDYCKLYKIDGEEVDEHEHWMDPPIVFDVEDVEEDMEDHNDPLFLTLPVAGCNIKKILIDGGSSVNVLLYDTFKRMEINDEQLLSSYHTIYGFNGAATKPLGDIVLQVDA